MATLVRRIALGGAVLAIVVAVVLAIVFRGWDFTSSVATVISGVLVTVGGLTKAALRPVEREVPSSTAEVVTTAATRHDEVTQRDINVGRDAINAGHDVKIDNRKYNYNIRWPAVVVIVLIVVAAVAVLYVLRPTGSAAKHGGGVNIPHPRGSPVAGQPPPNAPCSELPTAKACFDPEKGAFWVKDLPPGDADHAAVYWSSKTGPLHGQCHDKGGSHDPWVTCVFAAILSHHQRDVTFFAAVVNGAEIVDRGPTVTSARGRAAKPPPHSAPSGGPGG